MAKKSPKSTRRSRAKKQETTKKKPVSKVLKKDATIESSNDSAAEAVAAQADRPIEAAVVAEVEKLSHEPIDSILQPTRRRMLVSAGALAVIIVALVLGAAIIHQRRTNSEAQMVKSGLDSGRADQILQSGGSVCTNGNSQTDTTGSTNSDSVGMMLQSNPVSNVQTPQTLGRGADATTLQGATCF